MSVDGAVHVLIQLLVLQQLAGRALALVQACQQRVQPARSRRRAACRAPRPSAACRPCPRRWPGRRKSDRSWPSSTTATWRTASSFSSRPRLPSPALMRRVIVSRSSSDACSDAVGGLVVQQLAERPLAAIEVLDDRVGGGGQRRELAVELLVGEQLADRALAGADVLQQAGDLVDAGVGLLGDVGDLAGRLRRLDVAPVRQRPADADGVDVDGASRRAG